MESDQATSYETPEALANLCEEKVSTDAINRNAEKLVADGEGTLEKWISILTAVGANTQQIACSMVE